MRILVIEDEPAVAAVIAEALRRQGNEVDVVHTGEEGLQAIARSRPDAVFLDMVLPGMQGAEILRRVRMEHARLPVIVLSGWTTDADLETARQLGATEVMRKPLALKHLTAALERIRQT